MSEQIIYIEIDETHRIEVMPSGNHYPQHLVVPAWKDTNEGWGYYKTGNQARKFANEKNARAFLAKQSI